MRVPRWCAVCAFLAMVSVFLGACASHTPPTLRVVGASIEERTPEAVSIVLEVEAENPNAEPLPLREVQYEVMMDGKPAFSGTRQAEAVIRAYGTQRLRLPASIPEGREAGTFQVQGTLAYVPASVIRETLIDVGVPLPTVSFAGWGEISPVPFPKPDRMLRAPARMPTRP